jgi:hypothetical protein
MVNKALVADCQKKYSSFLFVQKALAIQHFNWLKFTTVNKSIKGTGVLTISGHRFELEVNYSPYFDQRFDRIYVKGITYHAKIHVYSDLSLCLYHPLQDMPILRTIPLVEMIPWITEWCIHYLEFKKYGVWLGKEIAHG